MNRRTVALGEQRRELDRLDFEDVAGCYTDRPPNDRLALRGCDLGYAMKDCQTIEFLLSPLGGAAVVVGAVLAFAGLLVWARRPGDAGRSAVVVSASALGVCVAGLNLALGATGVWQACTYRLPLIVLAAPCICSCRSC